MFGEKVALTDLGLSIQAEDGLARTLELGTALYMGMALLLIALGFSLE